MSRLYHIWLIRTVKAFEAGQYMPVSTLGRGRPWFIQESAVAASAGILDVTVSKDQRPMWYHRPIRGLYFSKTAVSMTLCYSVVSFLKRQLYVTLLSIVRMTTRGSQMVCYPIKEFCQSAFSGCVYNNYLKKKIILPMFVLLT